MSVGLTSIGDIAMAYAMDSYYPVAAESLLLINGAKNVVAFGLSFAAVPWVEHQGYAAAFGTMAGIMVFALLWAIPLGYFGHYIRHVTSTKLKIISW